MIELIPDSYTAQLDLITIFGRTAPLEVDLGCGDGSFICALAERNRDRNFLGIEKLAGRVAKTCRKAASLENVRVLNVEIAYAVRYLLPPESVATFYLLFPDPWPKRRHHRRRIVSQEFLDSVHRALVAGGLLRIATDEQDYFKQIQCVYSGNKRDGLKPSSFEIVSDDLDLPLTKFERRFRDQGLPIYRLSLRKISPVR